MSSYVGQTPDGDPVYLMGALERLEKGQSLRPMDWLELSAVGDRNEALRLLSEAGRAHRAGRDGIHAPREPLPPVLARAIVRMKSQVALLADPRKLPSRLARRIGRRQARKIERIMNRATGSQRRTRERSQRRRGRR